MESRSRGKLAPDGPYRLAEGDQVRPLPRAEMPSECGVGVYWWDGEYEGNCELQPAHGPLPHFDGLSWFDDDNHEVDLAPTPC